MASSSNVLLLLLTFFSFYLLSIAAYEYHVGDECGWKVPPSNDTKVFNEWASQKRFKVGDSIRFKYTHKKDSILEVDESGYKNCDSSHPMFSSTTGNTVYKFDRNGSFFFISGASDHCERGQKMTVKVPFKVVGSKSDGHKLSGYAIAAVLSYGVVAQFVLSDLF